MGDVSDVFGPEGDLARHIPGFQPRAAQTEMAAAVAEALENHEGLLAEAGTGTGKTFAYLVPALLSGLKIIISTGTKNLQDQLFHKDLPLVRQALGGPVTTALLKGRANYVCLHRLEANAERPLFRAPEQAAQYHQVRQWAGRTRTGDIAELDEIPEDAPVWPHVTSTADNCLGQECPKASQCHLLKARRAAQEADVVVVNHHLFFADMALRDEGFGELLPGANGVIFDEAHQLPETASSFFGTSLTSRQFQDLAADILAESQNEAPEQTQALTRPVDALEKAAADLRLAFGEQPRRGPWEALQQEPGIEDRLEALGQSLEALADALEPLAVRGKGLESCARRCREQGERLTLVTQASADHVHWFETFKRSFALHRTPMDIGETFHDFMQGQKCAWIFTSATLAVDGDFGHFQERLGLHGLPARRWDSPFDYPRSAVLYVPQDLPLPNDPGYIEAMVEAAVPVLEASRGRAFMLFTSHRALQRAHTLLESRLDYPLLVQGTMPRSRLLERFRQAGDAVLLGTASFWEGVDVRGEALSCVIIDKLPFAAHEDPVLKARLNAIREAGGDPFYDYQLPSAVITLRQGVGRLIRDQGDRGVMMLCDPRLISRRYGSLFLDSLPPMTRTRRLEVVQRFFKHYRDIEVSA